MEAKDIRATLVLAAVLFLLVGSSSAWFKKCYKDCYAKCRDVDHFSRMHCKVECLDDCIVPPLSEVDINCTAECAKSSCRHLDPETKDVEACVDSCSKNCTKPVKSP